MHDNRINFVEALKLVFGVTHRVPEVAWFTPPRDV
jgi:hypothetical protein